MVLKIIYNGWNLRPCSNATFKDLVPFNDYQRSQGKGCLATVSRFRKSGLATLAGALTTELGIDFFF